jgi:tRNA (guanine-N7-)-methyltransferase
VKNCSKFAILSKSAMNAIKELKIPFTWEERRAILLDSFFYIPKAYQNKKESFQFFDLEKPIAIEYCSGNGQWIGEKAKQNPDINWIAVEKKFVRARKIWGKMQRENISNLCVVCGEALEFTRYYAPRITKAFINFPDPWPKFRHAKHRLVRAEFLNELSRIMGPYGTITCVTDDVPYFNQMLFEFSQCPEWTKIFEGTDWQDYGDSFFKELWLHKGRAIHYLSYGKRA